MVISIPDSLGTKKCLCLFLLYRNHKVGHVSVNRRRRVMNHLVAPWQLNLSLDLIFEMFW